MSRIKEWLGSDSSFEDAETNGTDSTPEQPTQPTDTDTDTDTLPF